MTIEREPIALRYSFYRNVWDDEFPNIATVTVDNSNEGISQARALGDFLLEGYAHGGYSIHEVYQ